MCVEMGKQKKTQNKNLQLDDSSSFFWNCNRVFGSVDKDERSTAAALRVGIVTHRADEY